MTEQASCQNTNSSYVFSFGNCAFFFVLLVGFLFVSIFANVPAFIDQTCALHPVFLLTVYTTGVKISPIFFKSEEYLFPLIVACLLFSCLFYVLRYPTSARQKQEKVSLTFILQC